MTKFSQVEIIEDLQGLRGLESEWNEAFPPMNVEPWQSFNWTEAAATAFSKDHLLRIITVRKGGRLKAVAPLVLKPSKQQLNPLRLDFLGGEELKEPTRFISSDPDSLDQLMDVVVSEPKYPVRLSRVSGDIETKRYLFSKFKNSRWFVSVLNMPYPYLDLGVYSLSKSLKADLKRARMRAWALGEVKLEVITPADHNELLKYLERSFRIEAAGWKGRSGSAILLNEHRREFFERYAFSAREKGMLRLYFLLVNGSPMAVQYAIESSNAYWLLNIGYDEVYRKCSPGHLLLEESINYATMNGLARYNLLGKVEPWTIRWTSTTQNCLVLAAYHLNVHGVKAMFSDAIYLLKMRIKECRSGGRSRGLKELMLPQSFSRYGSESK